MRVAAVQMNSTADRGRNLATAERLVRAAAADGARLVALPEKWPLLATGATLAAGAEPLEGPAVSAVRGWASELGVAILAGSLSEEVDGGRAFNASPLVSAEGEVVAVYRKMHLFDVEVGGRSYRESAVEQAGSEVVTAPVEGLAVGMTVCYDLRFPELFRALAARGADLLTVPSAFTEATGRDHWEVLLRARAIENQAFVLAPNQIGEAEPGMRSYGRSMIVDPWGVVLATAPDSECFVAAELDLERLREVRRSLPALEHRRPELAGARGGA